MECRAALAVCDALLNPACTPQHDPAAGSATWRQRRRMAGALLLFGCVAGVLCTHAIMLSIQEEAEVVQLAQVSSGCGCTVAGAAQCVAWA